MSRIGKQPIILPAKTEANISENILTIKGPLGELKRNFKNDVLVKIEDGKIIVSPINQSIPANALWGTYASHFNNMVSGVNKPFEKKLILEGVGFKSEVKGSDLVLALGFSHSVKFVIPQGLTVTAEKNIITVSGIDKESVGRFAANLKAKKKPEPYKGKGMRYEGEIILRKQGKKTA